MTTNERISQWLGWSGPHNAFTAPYPWVEPGTCPEDERYHWNPPDYEHDIRCWHGEHGILAKIEARHVAASFAHQLLSKAEYDCDEAILWIGMAVDAPQLAAALVKVIEEAPDA